MPFLNKKSTRKADIVQDTLTWSEGDIAALVLLVMRQAYESAQEDFKAIMEEVKKNQRSKKTT